ncbi:hypothetical protein J6590_097982 [Homalodisca vitripennis]|nr:hypothetical protein J6590_097982 [Homalodisca vitripennis]
MLRKGKSTIDTVVNLVDFVVERFENRNTTLGVFLDLSKAFDCVEHIARIEKLESHGIRHLGKSKSLVDERTFVEINYYVQHFNSLNLKTNTSKTNVINFALRTVDYECGPVVMIADSILQEVYRSKFLDRRLTWNDYIDHLCAKRSSNIYVLRSLAPTQGLMTAYYDLIYPHLCYGLVLCGACANN